MTKPTATNKFLSLQQQSDNKLKQSQTILYYLIILQLMGNAKSCFTTKSSHTLSIDINISSWTKMHNLYDHLGSDLKTYNSFSTSQSIIIIKYQDEWKQITSMEQIDKINKNKIQSYFDVSRQAHSYSMFNNLFDNNGLGDGASVWRVIDDKEDLRVGDVIKLGRYRFKVFDMVTNVSINEEDNEVESQKTCKICYSNLESNNNPLLSPCKCSGTMKHIHLDCLRHWIAKTCKIISTEFVAEIPSKQVSCQLCGSQYQSIITHQGRMFCILYDNSIIKPPYIQLNLLQKDSNTNKTTFIVSFSNTNTIKIGRANNCQIQPKQDISISRVHAQLSLKNGILSIKNMNSKFGTLKLIKYPEEIFNMSLIRKYQIANSLIEVQTRSLKNQDKEREKEDKEKSKEARSIRDSLVGIQPKLFNWSNINKSTYQFPPGESPFFYDYQ